MRALPILSALAALACIAATPAAGPGAAFGNTIVSTYPNGRTAKLWLEPGGDYAAEGRRHDRSSGHWSVRGAKLCLRQSRPLPVPFSYCAPMIQGGVGSSWTGKAVTGEPIRLRLVAGRD